MKVRIGPIDYDIVEVKQLKASDDTTDLFGEIIYGKATIRLDRDMAPAVRQVCLWHEALHGVLVHAGLDLEENILEVLSYGIAQILRDNPEMRLNDG